MERGAWRVEREDRASRFALLRLLLRVKVDEALAEAAAVVAGGDAQEFRRVDRGLDGGLRRGDDRGQVVAVDDDLLHRRDAGRQSRLAAEYDPISSVRPRAVKSCARYCMT